MHLRLLNNEQRAQWESVPPGLLSSYPSLHACATLLLNHYRSVLTHRLASRSYLTRKLHQQWLVKQMDRLSIPHLVTDDDWEQTRRKLGLGIQPESKEAE